MERSYSLLLALATACAALSVSRSQPKFPGVQEGTPEPTTTPTEQPTAIGLGSGTEYLSPELWGLLYGQRAWTEVPERVSVLISENCVETAPSLLDFITAAGRTSQGNLLWESAQQLASVPCAVF